MALDHAVLGQNICFSWPCFFKMFFMLLEDGMQSLRWIGVNCDNIPVGVLRKSNYFRLAMKKNAVTLKRCDHVCSHYSWKTKLVLDGAILLQGSSFCRNVSWNLLCILLEDATQIWDESDFITTPPGNLLLSTRAVLILPCTKMQSFLGTLSPCVNPHITVCAAICRMNSSLGKSSHNLAI